VVVINEISGASFGVLLSCSTIFAPVIPFGRTASITARSVKINVSDKPKRSFVKRPPTRDGSFLLLLLRRTTRSERVGFSRNDRATAGPRGRFARVRWCLFGRKWVAQHRRPVTTHRDDVVRSSESCTRANKTVLRNHWRVYSLEDISLFSPVTGHFRDTCVLVRFVRCYETRVRRYTAGSSPLLFDLSSFENDRTNEFLNWSADLFNTFGRSNRAKWNSRNDTTLRYCYPDDDDDEMRPKHTASPEWRNDGATWPAWPVTVYRHHHRRRTRRTRRDSGAVTLAGCVRVAVTQFRVYTACMPSTSNVRAWLDHL